VRAAGTTRVVGGDDARQVQLADRLDHPGSADPGHVEVACRVGEAWIVGPQLAADHPDPWLERGAVDPNALDRAGGGTLAAGDLRALEGRPGRARRGEDPSSSTEHDLRVGADVDQQLELRGAVWPLGEHRRRGVGADVTGDARQQVHGGEGEVELEIARTGRHRAIGGQHERRLPQGRGVDAQHEVMHHRVADDRDVVHQ
jgi:hypothetical protein